MVQDSTCWTVIRGAAEGNGADRREFVRRYGGVIEAYLRRRWAGSPLRQDVEDAAQEVFLECFRKGGVLERAQVGGEFRAYLFGVVRNVARRLETARARQRVKAASSGLDLAAIHREQNAPNWQMNLGAARLHSGRFPEAEQSFRIAVNQAYMSNAECLQHLRQAERLAALQSRSVAILGGRAEAKDAAEAADLALFCLYRGSPAAALEYFEVAFARKPALDANRETGLHHVRIQATVMAADQAEAGLSEATAEDAAKLRAHALRLLGEETKWWRKLTEGEDLDDFYDRYRSWWFYEHPALWELDPSLASVRAGVGLSKRPEAEQAEWREFWSELADWQREVGQRNFNPRNERPR